MIYDIIKMRKACYAAAETLRLVGQAVRPGITTDELNRIVHNDTIKRGGLPAPLGYHGFPRSCCTSVNDVICHGIPGPYVLLDGDIVNIDVTTIVDGHFGDTNATFLVGNCSDEAQRLVATTREAMKRGVAAVVPHGELAAIGTAIQEFVESQGFNVVFEYGGHGIGTVFHDVPFVAHGRAEKYAGLIHRALRDPDFLKPGTTFTIEPMVNAGKSNTVLDDDGWTVRTKDGSLSAQFEVTVLVTHDGVEIIT